jgi:hypothetical protein
MSTATRWKNRLTVKPNRSATRHPSSATTPARSSAPGR